MRNVANRLFILGGVLSVLVLWMFMNSFATEKLRKRAIRLCAELDPSCRLEIGALSIPLFRPGHLTFTDVVMHRDGLEANLPKIAVVISWSALLRRQVSIDKLDIVEPTVTYIDRARAPSSVGSTEAPYPGPVPAPAAPPKSHDKRSEKSAWVYDVGTVNLRQGALTYQRWLHGKSAELHLKKIDIRFKPFGTTYGLAKGNIEATAKFHIENSPEVKLTISRPAVMPTLKVDAEVWIKSFDLAILNGFFQPNEGLVLQGHIVEGHGKVHVRGQKSLSKVRVVYDGLQVKLTPHVENGELETFFGNLATTLAPPKKKNLHQTRREQVGEFESERAPNDSIVHFMLESLKLGALEITGG